MKDSLAHLQDHLPWAIPYSDRFEQSQIYEKHRTLMHDIMHVQKSLGKLAALAERIDHGDYSDMDGDAFSKNVCDLVICALHIANRNPIRGFDLGKNVIYWLETRNGAKIPENP